MKKINLNMIKRNYFLLFNTLFIFIIFLFISYFIPLTGDDWTNANFNTVNILKYISIAYSKYFTHEGRFASRIFVLLFTNIKGLWNLVNALMVSFVYYFSIKIIKPKQLKFISILFIFSLIILENTCFTQTYLWVTGNSTYYLPMFLYITYIFLIRKIFDSEYEFNKIKIFFIIIINLLIPTMIEHISVVLLFTNLLLLIYLKMKKKEWNRLFLVNFIISLVGFLFIYLSPGAKLRAMEMEFSNYSLIKKVMVNIPNFINYTYIMNMVLLVLIFVVLIIYINNNFKSVKKILLLIFFTIIPFLTIIYKLLSNIQINSSKLRFILSKLLWTQNANNIVIIVFWFFITLVLFYINIKYIKEKNNYKAMLFYLVGIVANLSMLLSPIWGGRTTLFTVIMLSINLLILIDNYNIKYKNIITILLYSYLIYHIIILLITYNSVFKQQKDREVAINRGIKNEDKVIDIGRFPDDLLWNSNAWNKFHEEQFKKYYGIDDDIVIERSIVKYERNIFYKK